MLILEQERKRKFIRVNIARYLSFLLVFLSLVLIAYTVIPIIWQYISMYAKLYYFKSGLNLISVSYYYDPGTKYFSNIIDNYESVFSDIRVDTGYSKTMFLDIPSIGIVNMPITPNVDSNDKVQYEKALSQGAAHFKYTPLPGDGGNSFIYGHSTMPTIFEKYDAYEVAFTALKDLDIGNQIIITRDSEKLYYHVIRKKIVSPNDLEILNSVENKETITLMTCWPLGVGTHRLIIIAEKDKN